MPIYEYRCTQCGHRFSQLVRSVQAAEEGGQPTCPACGGDQVQRLISAFALRMGGGATSGEDGGDTGAAEPSKKVFGEKELKQALKDRGY